MTRTASPFDCTYALIARVRADVGDVERAGEQRGDRLGAGVEGLELERHVLAEAFCEDAALDADERRARG